MLQGTAQGSLISPLLFIAFINPLIGRLRACAGVRLTDDRIIRGLFFADDICLLAETMTDMRHMLAVCEGWAEELGMTFNAGKSEMMQLSFFLFIVINPLQDSLKITEQVRCLEPSC